MLFLLSKLPRRPVAHPFRGEAFHNICDTLLLFLLVSLCDLCVLLSVNSVLPSLFLRLPDLPQYLRSRIPWHHLHAHNLSPRCFHFLASHNLISRPVLAFHQHIRQQRRNHALWRRFIKYQHRVHAFQVSEYFRALLRPEHRSPRPLQLSHAFIAVQSHNQHIAQRARRFQAFDVPRMQQIETPVGKHHAPAVAFLLPSAALTLYSARGFTVRHYLVNAGSCPLTMDIVQKSGLAEDPQHGAVILFNGLAANKIIMSYLARSFAVQGLTVYVPDLPGHGRSNGPFSPDRAESCASSFVRGLAARGLIVPDHTMLVGHSMGGDIALRIAPQIRPAGVIAISPAPMQAAHGASAENLLYLNPPPLQPNTLILVAQYEFPSLVENAADLAASRPDPTVEFATIPG